MVSMRPRSPAPQPAYSDDQRRGKGDHRVKNLFEPGRAAELTERIERLRADSPRQWGTMTAPQALAHCAVAMEWAVGDTHAPRMMIGRVIGPLARRMAVRNDDPMPKNAPTSPDLRIADEHDDGTR